ncbi:translocation/assembly module TamB domain-containing protein [Deefgea salmonis]|uniref:Translocation/assembly module TamB domain-containing protein n=1 Tax=Deefgea salmonis TaxID=2875502 RepID=A0ABS8BGT4_9NEIS|nr:translocation/assembly module TamB domain-containing protein [Deefgea salmonis]MCB5194921.1 translocation/assembly module TamB domain-containing protein [Deefgea salmonis]
MNPDLIPEEVPTAAPVAAAKPVKSVFRRVVRGVFWSVLGSMTLLVALCAGLLFALDSDYGRARLVEMINRSGMVSIQSLQGSFWSRLEVNHLKVDTTSALIQLDHGVLDWSPYSLLLRKLYINELRLGTLQVETKPSPPMAKPSPVPESFTLPLSLQILELQIAQLQISGAPTLRQIQAGFDSNGKEHRITISQLHAPQGTLSAALNVSGKSPFRTAGSFVLAGQLEAQELTAVGQVLGDLRALAVKADLKSAAVRANVDVKLDVFAAHAYQILQHGQIELKQFNPAAWSSAAPQAKIDADLHVESSGGGVAMNLQFKNHQLGTLDLHGLPLASLTAQLQLTGNDLQVKQLAMAFGGQGRLSATGGILNEVLDLNLALQDIDPAQFWSPQAASKMSGQIHVQGPWRAPNVQGEIKDQRLKTALKLDLGWIKPAEQRRIAVRQLDLQRGSSQLAAKGELNLQAPFDFALTAQLQQFNPAEYIAASPAGRINSQIKASGQIEPTLRLDVDYQLLNSLYNQQALSGSGQLKLDNDRLKIPQLWLALGKNRLDLNGVLGKNNDQLNYQIDFPELQVLGKGFSGVVTGKGQLSGSMQQANVQGTLNVKQLNTPWALEVGSADLFANVQSDLKGPIELRLAINQLAMPGLQIANANVLINGRQDQHTVTLTAKGNKDQHELALDVLLKGGLNASRVWQGQIERLNGMAWLPFQLQNAASLSLASDQLRLSGANLQVGRSVIDIGRFDWRNGAINTQGQIKQLQVSDLLNLLDNTAIQSDLILAGQWDLTQSAPAAPVNGRFELARQQGDVVWRGHDGLRPFLLDALALKGAINQNQLNVNGQLSSPRYGKVGLTASGLLDAAQWQVSELQAMKVALVGDLPDLKVFSPFVGDGVVLGGRAHLDVTRVALGDKVSLAGQIKGTGLLYKDAGLGVHLREGVVDIGLDGQQITLKTMKFNGSGSGLIEGSGRVDLKDSAQPDITIQLAAKKFTLISKADMLLVISGQGTLAMHDGALAVNGQFVADEGDIQFVSNDVPHLSSDVVVLGATPKKVQKAMSASVEIGVDLGKNFRFRGYGLDAELIGQLRLKASGNQALSAHGTVSVEEGEYKAYGQKLEIERGVLSFIGPLDNPGLDILAVRTNLAVEAGVKVQGSAYSPRVTLYSDPNVPDSEKLSWLLFGHGSENMEKADGALILQVLNAMASNNNGQGLTDQLFGAVGIDEVGYNTVREKDGSTTQVVSVSKQLAKNLRVSLDKSFNGLRDAVRFTWQLSRNWAVVSRIGVDESSLNVDYTWQFD